MSKYRRINFPGGTYFFTVVTYERYPIFAQSKNIDILRNTISKVKKKYPFSIHAYVILPDHLHFIWRLPNNDNDFSTRWKLIKRNFNNRIEFPGVLKKSKSLWQKRFWEHYIRDEKDHDHHLNYIHFNPVKHAYVNKPIDWKYSSFQHWVKKGWYPEDWNMVETTKDLKRHYGE